MRKVRILNGILITAFVLVGVIIVAIIIGLNLPKQPEEMQGLVETTDYRLSSKVPSRVLEIRVKEGDHVKRGDTLVVLTAPELNAKMSQAQSAYSAAHSQEEKADNGTRIEQIQSACDLQLQAKAAMQLAEKTYHRVDRLFQQGVVTAQKRDEALAQYQAATAAYKAALSQYNMAVNGAREEDKSAARSLSRQVKGVIKEVSAYLNETYLVATADGDVTEIFPEIGELVGSGAPIMNVATSDLWFTFNVREDLLPGLYLGAKAKVFSPALGKTISVRITRINDVGSFAQWKATRSLGGFDLKTFEVRARPLQTSGLRGLYSGMSVVLKK